MDDGRRARCDVRTRATTSPSAARYFIFISFLFYFEIARAHPLARAPPIERHGGDAAAAAARVFAIAGASRRVILPLLLLLLRAASDRRRGSPHERRGVRREGAMPRVGILRRPSRGRVRAPGPREARRRRRDASRAAHQPRVLRARARDARDDRRVHGRVASGGRRRRRRSRRPRRRRR